MTPAAPNANAIEFTASVVAPRTGSAFRAARTLRRPRLFNDYGPASARLFHAWRP